MPAHVLPNAKLLGVISLMFPAHPALGIDRMEQIAGATMTVMKQASRLVVQTLVRRGRDEIRSPILR